MYFDTRMKQKYVYFDIQMDNISLPWKENKMFFASEV